VQQHEDPVVVKVRELSHGGVEQLHDVVVTVVLPRRLFDDVDCLFWRNPDLVLTLTPFAIQA
jgi:hypothetical protein